MTLSGILAYLRGRSRTPAAKLAAIYLAGWLLLIAGYFAGIVGPLTHKAGFVAWAIVALVTVHTYSAICTVGKMDQTGDYVAGEAATAWLEKIDASILGLGFLGKLYAIATALAAIGGTGDPAAALAGIAVITAAISSALFATMAGLGVSLWTHCATIVVSNYAAEHREPRQSPLPGFTIQELATGSLHPCRYQPVQDAEFVEVKADGS